MKRLPKKICFCILLFLLTIGMIGTTYQKTRIIKVESSLTEVYLGSNVDLPEKAKVKYDNGKTSYVPIKWNKKSLNTTKAGLTVCKGTVKGYAGGVVLVYNVIPLIKKSNEYSFGQLMAMNKCLKYIKRNFPTTIRPINKQVVTIITASSIKVKEYFSIDGTQYKLITMDSADWIISIGSTIDHDFHVLVCDSDNYEVLGFLPID